MNLNVPTDGPSMLEALGAFIAKVGFSNSLVVLLVGWLVFKLSAQMDALTVAIHQLNLTVQVLSR